jgi:hypothetical protein
MAVEMMPAKHAVTFLGDRAGHGKPTCTGWPRS